MPHKLFRGGSQTANVVNGASLLVPGIEPGGSKAGRPVKPALMLVDARVEINDYTPVSGTGTELLTVYLKLSQELDMDPGLLLPIAEIGTFQANATGTGAIVVNNLWQAGGTLWAPRVVAIRQQEVGAIAWNVDVHLDYEVVDVPWMDWFIMWDFLDNVVNNARDY